MKKLILTLLFLPMIGFGQSWQKKCMLLDYYQIIVQDLKTWEKPAPKLKEIKKESDSKSSKEVS
tara:strand:+ start:254 stop:445 length:192 start_codon:yes stop_codon:yes gene_type:complete